MKARHSLPDELALQKLEPSTWVDTEAVQRRINEAIRRYGTMRVHFAAFRVPWPCTRSQYEGYRKEAVDKWLAVQERKGHRLRSKVHVDGPFDAYSYSGDWANVPLLDHREFRVKAAFTSNEKLRRLELPLTMAKRPQ